MSAITFSKFDFGLDLRKGPSTSDANRLRVLTNAYVTTGKTIKKRPGTVKEAVLEPGTVGLSAGKGKLNTFYAGAGTVTHANPLFVANKIVHPTTGALTLSRVWYCDVFNGFLYVAGEYQDTSIVHSYIDGTNPPAVTDTNCPQTRSVTKKAQKIWAIGDDGDTVRFSKTSDPRDWTTANDAGFLPVGLQQSGATAAKALGEYNAQLAVLFPDSAQIWTVDTDPQNNILSQTVDVGSKHPYSHANMASDVFFLSPQGVRSITNLENTTNLIDVDVGSPVDPLIYSIFGSNSPKAIYYRGGGQFWLYYGNKALVYTFSRTGKISAWSVYEFPYSLDYLTELDAELYIRSEDSVYRMDDQVFTDDGEVFRVEAELAFLDFKSPGVLKQVWGMDIVFTGTGTIAHRYDVRIPELITSPPVELTGDSRPGRILPVELLATNLAPVIVNENDGEFELHAISYYFETLGVQV